MDLTSFTRIAEAGDTMTIRSLEINERAPPSIPSISSRANDGHSTITRPNCSIGNETLPRRSLSMTLPHIQIGDNLIGDALLSSVEVIQELNQHWWCTIVCKQTPDQRIPVEDFLGKTVSLKT